MVSRGLFIEGKWSLCHVGTSHSVFVVLLIDKDILLVKSQTNK